MAAADDQSIFQRLLLAELRPHAEDGHLMTDNLKKC